MTPRPCLSYCLACALLQGCVTSAPLPPAPPPAAQAAALSPEATADAYYQLARTHHEQGNLELALIGYRYAVTRNPAHVQARSAAAAIHAQQGRLDQARGLLLEVVGAHPTLAQAHSNLGYIEYLRGDHKAAANSMRKALVLDPANAHARNNLRLVDAALPPAPTATAASVPVVASAIELVQVVPNVYELRAAVQAGKAATPVRTGQPRLVVANGEGTPGLARRVGALLRRHGHPVAGLANDKPFGQRGTRIEYRPGHEALAAVLGKLIEGPVRLTPSPALAGADLRVVLGANAALALRARAAARLAAR